MDRVRPVWQKGAVAVIEDVSNAPPLLCKRGYLHVRQLLGYRRLDNQEIVSRLAGIMRDYSLLKNLFYASCTLVSKVVIGSYTKKLFDDPKTRYQRVLEHPMVDERQNERLRTGRGRCICNAIFRSLAHPGALPLDPWNTSLEPKIRTPPISKSHSRVRISFHYLRSTTCKQSIDLPAMRLVNVATKKSRPIQRIEVFTKTFGVELPLKT